jgi:ankyrin repeat protein
MAEVEKTRPLLIDWYIDNHSIALETAQQYADNALTAISNYGFGSYYYYWEPEELVPFTREAIDGNYGDFLNSLNNSSDKQKINSLRRLLIHLTPKNVIEKLVNSIAEKTLVKRSESPISNVVYNPNYLRLLLEAGFDPNHQNYFGKTALYYAIQHNQHESVIVLLDNGADINHTYQLEKEGQWDCSGIKQWGRTPLMHASQHSDVEMIRLLLKRGANIHDKDALGSTALEYAAKNGRIENQTLLTIELEKKPFDKSLQLNANAPSD